MGREIAGRAVPRHWLFVLVGVFLLVNARYDPHRFGASGDAMMLRWLRARETGVPVSPYSLASVEVAQPA